MTRRRLALVAFATALAGCAFDPDLSRFPECTANRVCPEGFTCLTETNRCVPACGEACDGGAGPRDAGADAGGVDAGAEDGGDAGAGDDAGAALRMPASALEPAIETWPWSHRFVPSGGSGTYFFSLDAGPPGFTLAVDGTLSTTAAPQPGSYPFEVTVSDDATPRAQVTTPFELAVRPLLRVASRAPLSEGRQGQAYAEALSATGGQPPYAWALDGGALPTGLSLTDAGVVEGTPGQTGLRDFGVVVTDSATPPQRAFRQLSVNVKLLDTLLVVATTAAADGRVGTAYSQTLEAWGGTQPYNWSVVSGALPPGVMLVDSGTVGRLGGTPTQSGTWTFSVRVDDLLTNKTQSLSITVF